MSYCVLANTGFNLHRPTQDDPGHLRVRQHVGAELAGERAALPNPAVLRRDGVLRVQRGQHLAGAEGGGGGRGRGGERWGGGWGLKDKERSPCGPKGGRREQAGRRVRVYNARRDGDD